MKSSNGLNQNKILLQKLKETVLANLANEQFGVEELAGEVGMSRSNLHRKLKGIEGKSISQFIRDVRLEEAMKMLKENVATTSEIAYLVGFNSSTYFHKCFNKKYGHPPGEVNNPVKERIAATSDESDLRQNVSFSSNKTSFEASEKQTGNKLKKPKITIWNLLLLLLVIVFIFWSIKYFLNYKDKAQNSIAVLPLKNFTNDPEQDYFVNGMHTSLINSLGQVSGLRVISRTSTSQYKNQKKTLTEIAEELKVNTILEGSVVGNEDQVKIQLQLIGNFPEEMQLWSKVFDQDFGKIMILQSEIVKSITNEIHVSLTEEENNNLANAKTINPDAYKAYLKGMYHWEKLTEKDLNTAMNYFDLALEIEPDYSLAYAGKCYVWGGRMQQGLTSYFEGGAHMKIEELKVRAQEIENPPAEIHYVMGVLNCWQKWNYQEAEIELKKTIAINPSFSAARAYLSHVLNILHKPEEAVEQSKTALDLDPFNPLFQALDGMTLMHTREFDKAIDQLGKTLQTAPTDPVALSTLRTAYHMKGMYPEALEIWKTSYAAKEDEKAIEALLRGEQENGYTGALESLAEELILRSETTYVTPWQIATLYTRAGNIEKALFYLEKAFIAHDPNMPYIGIDPIFDFLREDPRFVNLLKKMNLPLAHHPWAD
ncbi:helix-turn-helix domain-containing protein [Flexithrix dorotheae]|uniref:helix-turn-helix domain-containing protein n=1 Tax=Flexithrix dorotheae TaxID=70993 RepID=UPI000365F5B7|nr:helix-turn-helix domain-containing protein [Flexithrix dorotheae]